MRQNLLAMISQAEKAIGSLKSEKALAFITLFVEKMQLCFSQGHKILTCGNGGSFADCMHFAEELTGFFDKKRRALPAMVLADAAHMSCVSNDLGFDSVFSRMTEAFATSGDLLLILSTSGNSTNVIEAARAAKKRGVEVIGLLGRGGGKALELCDTAFVVPEASSSDRIQEVHMTLLHMSIDLLEKKMFFPQQMTKDLQAVL